MRLWLLLAMLCLPFAAVAQDNAWQLETFESDVTRSANLTTPSQRMIVFCGEVLTDETSLYEDIYLSGPGHFNWLAPERLMGTFDPNKAYSQTVMAEANGAVVELPPFFYDDVSGQGWVARVAFDHPVIEMALSGAEIVLKPDLGTEFSLWADALAEGLTAMMDHCNGNVAKTGPDVDPQLVERARVQAFQMCQAAFDLPKSAMRSADVTGDGVPDLLVNFGALRCTEGLFANAPVSIACANEMCRHDVYSTATLSLTILHGKKIETVEDRPGDVRVFMDTASCASMNAREGCAIRMRWTAQTFATVGLE